MGTKLYVLSRKFTSSPNNPHKNLFVGKLTWVAVWLTFTLIKIDIFIWKHGGFGIDLQVGFITEDGLRKALMYCVNTGYDKIYFGSGTKLIISSGEYILWYFKISMISTNYSIYKISNQTICTFILCFMLTTFQLITANISVTTMYFLIHYHIVHSIHLCIDYIFVNLLCTTSHILYRFLISTLIAKQNDRLIIQTTGMYLKHIKTLERVHFCSICKESFWCISMLQWSC